MKIFISGGCKNGKSYYALKLAAQLGEPRYYIATMIPSDNEDDDRIARHRAERDGFGFETIELTKNIDSLPAHCDLNGAYLLDSVTALLANEMFAGGDYLPRAHEKIIADLMSLVQKTQNIVIVSDYIYSDAFLYDSYTENYRKGLGLTDRAAASACDAVVEVSFGSYIIHKQGKGFARIHEKVI